jgi:hypothetical protein
MLLNVSTSRAKTHEYLAEEKIVEIEKEMRKKERGREGER